jgi:flagellar motor switch protein FliM
LALEDALTQDELESLLAGLADMPSGGSAPAPGGARLYEVGREPTVLPWLPALDRINQRFAQLLSARFDAVLWKGARARIAASRNARLLDAIEAFPEDCLYTRVRARGLRGDGLLVIGNTLAEAAVERMLGGAGRIAAPRRMRTQIELRLLRRLAEVVAAAYEAAWRPLNRMRFDLSPLQSDRNLLDQFDPTQTVAVFEVQVAIAEEQIEGFRVLLPSAMLAPLREVLDGRLAALDPTDDRWRAAVESAAGKAGVELAAKIKRRIPLRRFLALSVGDVLPVDAPGDTVGEVNGMTVLTGRSGAVGGRTAVEVDTIRSAPVGQGAQ